MKNLLKNIKNKKARAAAFTLVEILIVVAVIGILFVALVPRIDFAGDKARETGVKTDFRSFELAAEQVIRENGGLAKFTSATTDAGNIALLCGTNGLNLYLDEAMKFDDDGTSNKKDQWNQNYTLQITKDADDDNPNNGTIIFISNGKDSTKSTVEENYALVVTVVDGRIETATKGFSTNIESDYIVIGEDDSTSMDIASTGIATVKYAKAD